RQVQTRANSDFHDAAARLGNPYSTQTRCLFVFHSDVDEMRQNPPRIEAHDILPFSKTWLRCSALISATARILSQSETNALPIGNRRTQQCASEPYGELVYARDRASWNDESISDDDRRN